MNTTTPSASPLGAFDALRAALGPRILAGLHHGQPIHPENGAARPPSMPPFPPCAEASPSEPPQPARHPGGRPNTCTDDTLELICEGIAKGLSDTAAAALIGVPASTLSRWKKDQDGVVDTFTAARERYRALLLDRLHNAKTRDGRDDWRATAWLLERSFPEDYGRKALSRCSSPDEDSTPPAAKWNDYPDPDRELARRDRWTPFVAERRRQEAERAALEAELASEAQTPGAPTSETSETATYQVAPDLSTPEAPTSKTSETGSEVLNSTSTKSAPNSSETSETLSAPAGESSELEPDLDEPFSDSLPAQPNLSRRERRRRAHLQRKAQAARQRVASKTAPLAAAA